VLTSFFESIGIATHKRLSEIFDSLRFTWIIFKNIFDPKSYSIASVEVLVKQIYFTSIQILPFYIFLSMVVGSVIIGLIFSISLSLNMQDQIGSIIVNVLINEIGPLLTVLLLALRSGTAMTTEIAVMNVSHEMDSLKFFNINPVKYLFVPRIINGVVSMLLLSSTFIFISLIAGYMFLALVLQMGLSLYIHTLVEAFSVFDLIILLVKSMLFGYVIAAIPVYRGNKPLKRYNEVPIAVLQGMVKLFIAILFVEVLSFIRFL
jgi:phospholipid/cholesterol/gamma-HCH transport system permease protein